MDKAAPDLPNGPELEEEEGLMEDIRIYSGKGTEYEIQFTVPPHLKKYCIPHAQPIYFFGPCGDMLFQKIRGELGSAWENLFFPKTDMTVTGVYHKPFTEVYASVVDSFEITLNKQTAPATKAGHGGVMHARGVESIATLKGGRVYHNRDVHLYPRKMQRFANEHPHLYELLNDAEKKRPGAIPKTLHVNGDLAMIMHQLKNPVCAPAFTPEYCSRKITEYLMTVFWQIDPKDPHKPIVISNTEIDKAIAAEKYMRAHLKEDITTAMLAAKFHTNIRYLQIAFKQHFNTTIIVYLRKLRMSKAKIDLLEKPKESIDSIALDVGYNSRADFSKAFRKEFGCLPTEFRKAAGIKEMG